MNKIFSVYRRDLGNLRQYMEGVHMEGWRTVTKRKYQNGIRTQKDLLYTQRKLEIYLP